MPSGYLSPGNDSYPGGYSCGICGEQRWMGEWHQCLAPEDRQWNRTPCPYPKCNGTIPKPGPAEPNVPIPLFKVAMSPDAPRIMNETLLSGYIGQGPRVDEFEGILSRYFESPILTMNSCTSALSLALYLAGVRAGDEVITTPLTCTATNGAIVTCGAIPVWADVTPKGVIDPESVSRLLSTRTKAIMAVDWGGDRPDYRTLKTFGYPVIQDAAHSFRASDHLGDYTCFPSTTLITTDQGPKRISEVRIGDKVLTESGQYRSVLVVHKNLYRGNWVRIKAGQARVVATANHPVRTSRGWIRADEVRIDDKVYVTTRLCCKCGKSRVPFYGTTCHGCYGEINRGHAKRVKVQSSKLKHEKRKTRLEHHYRDVEPVMMEYEANGYRTIPLIRALPDFIAIKDGKVVAVEVECRGTTKLSKEDKYGELGDVYDEVVWRNRETDPTPGRYTYEIDGEWAIVPVVGVRTRGWISKHGPDARVSSYNLTVDQDPTYVANGFLVHNCWSFQAIKILTTGDGGALACPEEQYARAKLLRWYGLDRESKADFRCDQDIQEVGWKYHMNDIAASIGIANFELARLNSVRHWVNGEKICGGTALRWVGFVRVRDRQAFIETCARAGISTSLVHKRNDVHTAFRKASKNPDDPRPNLEAYAKEYIAVPVGWWLTEKEVDMIQDVVGTWKEKYPVET